VRRLARLWLVALALAGAAPALGHEFTLEAVVNAFVVVGREQVHVVVRGPLYLFREARFPSRQGEIDVDAAGPAVETALARLQQGLVLSEDGEPLKATSVTGRLTLPSDRSFETYEQAAAHVATAPEPGTRLVVDQGFLDAHLVYPATPGHATVYALRSTLMPDLGDYLKLAVRFTDADGTQRALALRSGRAAVDLNPSWIGAAQGFVALGIEHIVTGWDHLLFLLCLVVPLRGARSLLLVVTAFTLAHSATLIGSAFGLAPRGDWFAPLVEMAIAGSIVYAAIENIFGVTVRRRVLLALAFGLVHGFAFSTGLQQQLQFAGTHLVVSLFAFNLGIELGQLAALAVMLPLLALLTRHVLKGRAGTIVLSVLVAHAAWHLMEDRWQAVAQSRWPVLDLVSLMWLVGWLGLLAAAVFAGAAVLGHWNPEADVRTPRRPEGSRSRTA
jgi:hypothetical protein